MKTFFTTISLSLIFTLSACSQNNDNTTTPENTKKSVKITSIHGQTMGTSYSVKFVVPKNVHVNEKDVRSKISSRLDEINKAMSTYDKTSEITKLNQQTAGKYSISQDFYNTLAIAHDVSEKSSGAFDVTVSPLINIWGFGHKGTVGKQPTAEQIKLAKQQIGYTKIKLLDNNQIEKMTSVTLNLSAVAKGYGVDALAETIETFDIDNYFVEIGGEVVTKGNKDGTGWKVGIEKPSTAERSIQQVLDVSNIALATSGDYRNYFEEDGIRFSHTIDPTTGYPIKHTLASVSVLHENCASADAYATALMVMGDKKGIEFAKQHNIDALFIVKSDTNDKSSNTQKNGFVEISTGNFAKRILTKPE